MIWGLHISIIFLSESFYNRSDYCVWLLRLTCRDICCHSRPSPSKQGSHLERGIFWMLSWIQWRRESSLKTRVVMIGKRLGFEASLSGLDVLSGWDSGSSPRVGCECRVRPEISWCGKTRGLIFRNSQNRPPQRAIWKNLKCCVVIWKYI